MRESEAVRGARSKPSVERVCKFGTVVRALWPDKPALNLAQRMGISERGAQYIIDGQRRVPARALVVVMDEID
jgi:hypothetical protein